MNNEDLRKMRDLEIRKIKVLEQIIPLQHELIKIQKEINKID